MLGGRKQTGNGVDMVDIRSTEDELSMSEGKKKKPKKKPNAGPDPLRRPFFGRAPGSAGRGGEICCLSLWTSWSNARRNRWSAGESWWRIKSGSLAWRYYIHVHTTAGLQDCSRPYMYVVRVVGVRGSRRHVRPRKVPPRPPLCFFVSLFLSFFFFWKPST